MQLNRPASLIKLWVTLTVVVLLWTGLFLMQQNWARLSSDQQFLATVRLKAEMRYHTIQVLQDWIGLHGGVYVAVDKDVQPNQFLAGVPERDVVTPGGQHLTLYNAQAFLRQVLAEFEAKSGNRVHLVSDEPINPSNHPDAWEQAGLHALASGKAQYDGLTTTSGHNYYRLMRPMILHEPCLRCHDFDKNAVGKMIGAISVSLDSDQDLKLHGRAERAMMLTHFSMWALGILGILTGGWRWHRLLMKLEKSVVCDSLTGLYNRRELLARLESEIASAKRYETQLAIVMLDIDHFKAINDSCGHQAGDKVLASVAQLMRDNVRTNDVLVRFGGEEFIIVCPQTDEAGALIAAERVRRAVLETPIETRVGEVCITISAGIAVYQPQLSSDEFIKLADGAMYRAKHDGRNCVRVHGQCDDVEESAIDDLGVGAG